MAKLRSQVALMFCVAVTVSLVHVQNAAAVKIWESTFDSGPDGVVSLYDNNFEVEMIGSASGGRLTVNNGDYAASSAYSVDKGGRPLGVTQTYNTSQSAQYKFRWSAMPITDEANEGYQFAGFLGPAGPATRQIMGSLLTHWYDSGNHYLGLGIAVQGVGFTNFGYDSGPVINLGPDPVDTDYELRIEFDGTTHFMAVKLLDSAANLIAENSRDLDIHDPPVIEGGDDADIWDGWFDFGTTAFNNEINSIQLEHLGWSGYTGWAATGDKLWPWQVDSLAWWDEGTVPLPINETDTDYNNDGSVDAADYVAWRKLPENFGGDPGGYDAWVESFGTTTGGGGGAAGVPEPTTGLLCLTATLLVALRRRPN